MTPALVAGNSRHPGDAVRVALGLAALLVALLAVQRDDLSTFETDVFRLVNNLPSWLAQVLGPIMQLGNVLAAPVLGAVALVVLRHRWRVAIDITVGGTLAWLAARVVKSLVERPRPSGLIDDINRLLGSPGLGFVSGHTAVAAAIVTAAAPYLPRRLRRALWILPWLVGAARVFYGVHLPLDIVGGAALGWVVGSGFHLIFGAPHRVPELDEAAAVLEAAGAPASAVERVPGTPRGSFPFVADVAGGTVFVKLLDPEPRDRDWIYRAARFLAFRDVRDEAAIADAPAQAHREAAMALLARSRGVCAPAIQGIEAHRDRVWVVQEYVAGTSLDRAGPEQVSDGVLKSLFAQVRLLRDARIAHRDLVASNVILEDGGRVWIVDFAHAQSWTGGHELDNDVAELLASTALVVGVERAVDGAAAVLGAETLAAALPELQPFVLTAETRERLRQGEDLLDELRQAVTERVALEHPPPAPVTPAKRRLRRMVASGSTLGAGGALIAVAGPTSVAGELAAPGFRWLGLAVLCSVVAPIAGASMLLAAIDRRLALGRTALVLLHERRREIFEGRRQGRVGVIDYLERAGVREAEATRGWARREVTRLAALVIAGLLATAAAASGVAFSVPSQLPVLVLLAAVVLAGEVVVRDRPWPWPPRQLACGIPSWSGTNLGVLLVAGGVELASRVIATVAVVEAMGGGASVVGAAAVAALAQVVAYVGPVARGPGLGMVALAAGFSVVGAPVDVAVTAAILSQVLLVWLPVAVARVVPDSAVLG
ncbi:MAG TPA: phosphatase PAP2 family protein [Acidimicrobiales bacterium]|nr:phosphatase PAP2 family protein [Acidimicrobiales bacterium]